MYLSFADSALGAVPYGIVLDRRRRAVVLTIRCVFPPESMSWRLLPGGAVLLCLPCGGPVASHHLQDFNPGIAGRTDSRCRRQSLLRDTTPLQRPYSAHPCKLHSPHVLRQGPTSPFPLLCSGTASTASLLSDLRDRPEELGSWLPAGFREASVQRMLSAQCRWGMGCA